MSDQDEHSEGQVPPERPESEPQLSASFLPYDDERLWLQMKPGDTVEDASAARTGKPGRGRKQKGSSTGAQDAKASRGPRRGRRERLPAGAARPRRGRRRGRAIRFALGKASPARNLRLALIAAAVLVPVSAFAFVGGMGGDASQSPVSLVPGASVSASPSPPIDLGGLEATATAKRVKLTWNAPNVFEDFTYRVFRSDGYSSVAIGDTEDTTFIDLDVAGPTYYYYLVTGAGSLGTVAQSSQILVAVPSASGEFPDVEDAPPPPPTTTYYPPPSPTPSPTATKSPSPSPSPSPTPTSTSGGGGGVVVTTTTAPPPTTTAPPPTTTAPPPTTTAPPPSPTTTSPSPTPCDPADPLCGGGGTDPPPPCNPAVEVCP